MELEKQVSSLEPSIRLAELGVKQTSLYYWTNQPQIDAVFIHEGPGKNLGDVSAFTVAELGEMLPGNYEFTFYTNNGGGLFHLSGGGGVVELESMWADTEADARAKMLIYLLENKLVTL